MGRHVRVKTTFQVLGFDEDGHFVHEDDADDVDVATSLDQFAEDELELWKERDDGFLFVYCNNYGIGYWVTPSLVEIIEND